MHDDGDERINYKEMYLKLMRAAESALTILIKAQQECEEMYVTARDEPENGKK